MTGIYQLVYTSWYREVKAAVSSKAATDRCPVVIGVDQGTTGTTAVACAVEGEKLLPLTRAYRRVHPSFPRPSWVDQDATELLDSVVETVGTVVEAVGWQRVQGVGLANQGETSLAWDRGTSAPVGPALSWQDQRTQPVLDDLERRGAAQKVRAKSLLPLHPYFAASKLSWFASRSAGAERGAVVLGTTDAWMRAVLSGSSATDPATASRTQLLDLQARSWDPWLAQAFGVPLEALPRIEPNTGGLGTLADARWPARLPLTAATVDQQAALVGHGCTRPGEAVATYGTGCFVLANAGGHVPVARGLIPTVGWDDGETAAYALDGGVLTASAVFSWLVRIGVLSSADQADAVAATVTDSGGVRCVPAFAGLGAPYWHPGSHGMFMGLSMATEVGHVVRAAMEGIAHRVADIIDKAQEVTGPLTALRVGGGLSGSHTLMQIQADVLGVPVEIAEDREMSAYGAARLAAVGAGFIDGVADLRPGGSTVRVEPVWSTDRRDVERSQWRAVIEVVTEGGSPAEGGSP